ncbi:Fc.00g009540.m01.CDS01 [Cosmosporella sp. VM-42]
MAELNGQNRGTSTVGMPRLANVWYPEDDWTGITKTADRRKRQNRLNQRAYRRRKQIQRVNGLELSDDPQNPSQQLVRSGGGTEPSTGYRFCVSPQDRALTYAFMQKAYTHYTLNAPKPTYLPSLIRLNVLNAVSHNAAILGFPVDEMCRDDFISPFNELGPSPAPSEERPPIPDTLKPTPIQMAMLHHPWIDLFPFPKLRENMLRGITEGNYDEDELCLDILSVVHADTRGAAYLIVWGQPWDACGWEVSVGFLKKWGWLLQGCSEIIESTNRWRESRGESRLDIKL